MVNNDGAVASGRTIGFAGTTGGELVLSDPSGSALSFSGITLFGQYATGDTLITYTAPAQMAALAAPHHERERLVHRLS